MQKIRKIENIIIDEENKRFKMDKVVVPNSKKRGCLSKLLLISITNIFYPFFKKGEKKNTDWFSFDDLVSYELIQNDDVVVTGGVGKAVVGGAVIGRWIMGNDWSCCWWCYWKEETIKKSELSSY